MALSDQETERLEKLLSEARNEKGKAKEAIGGWMEAEAKFQVMIEALEFRLKNGKNP
jgi:hypothetical protein